jgi:hypothetical protein
MPREAAEVLCTCKRVGNGLALADGELVAEALAVKRAIDVVACVRIPARTARDQNEVLPSSIASDPKRQPQTGFVAYRNGIPLFAFWGWTKLHQSDLRDAFRPEPHVAK